MSFNHKNSLNALKNCRFIDLSHKLNNNVPTWNGTCGFENSIKMDYSEGCRVQAIKMHAGVGTHMDAPSHFIPSADSIADIPLSKLIVPVSVIDISHKITPTYELSVEDIRDYETKHNIIVDNSFVIAYTGWSKYWSDARKYRNENVNGYMEFPGFSVAAAELLLERGIVGIGIDTLSPECKDASFPIHHLILGAGCYIIENLNNCHQLPEAGGYIIALPLNVENGTESAIRAIGVIGNIIAEVK